MLTQAELYSSGDFLTRWLAHDQEQPFKAGQKLGLMEDPSRVWIIGRVYMSLNEERQLPPNAMVGKVLAFLEADGLDELSAVYPRISVV